MTDIAMCKGHLFKSAKNWQTCKQIAFEYYGTDCLYIKKVGCIPLDMGGLSAIDPAHIFGKGAYPHMRLIPANVIPLNRYVHTLLDQYLDPQRPQAKFALSKEERQDIFRWLVGFEIYNNLAWIGREK